MNYEGPSLALCVLVSEMISSFVVMVQSLDIMGISHIFPFPVVIFLEWLVISLGNFTTYVLAISLRIIFEQSNLGTYNAKKYLAYHVFNFILLLISGGLVSITALNVNVSFQYDGQDAAVYFILTSAWMLYLSFLFLKLKRDIINRVKTR